MRGNFRRIQEAKVIHYKIDVAKMITANEGLRRGRSLKIAVKKASYKRYLSSGPLKLCPAREEGHEHSKV